MSLTEGQGLGWGVGNGGVGEWGVGVWGVGETQEAGGRSVDTESTRFPEAGTWSQIWGERD